MLNDFETLARAPDSPARTKLVERLTWVYARLSEAERTSIIASFEDVVTRVLATIEEDDRAALSSRFANLPNAPIGVLRHFAHDTSTVARNILRHSPRLDDEELSKVAKLRDDGHRLAIAQRIFLSEPVSDTLIQCGSSDVLRAVAANDGAQISTVGYDRLLNDAISDRVLRELVAGRERLPEVVRSKIAPLIAAEVGRRFQRTRTAQDDRQSYLRLIEALDDGDIGIDEAIEAAIEERRPVWVVDIIAHAGCINRAEVMSALMERGVKALSIACYQTGVSAPTWKKLLDFRAKTLGIGSNAPRYLREYGAYKETALKSA
jgi:hypothetical protein